MPPAATESMSPQWPFSGTVVSFLRDPAGNGWPPEELLLIDIISAEGYPSTTRAIGENRFGQPAGRRLTGGAPADV
jgi:hypothetical protein